MHAIAIESSQSERSKKPQNLSSSSKYVDSNEIDDSTEVDSVVSVPAVASNNDPQVFDASIEPVVGFSKLKPVPGPVFGRKLVTLAQGTPEKYELVPPTDADMVSLRLHHEDFQSLKYSWMDTQPVKDWVEMEQACGLNELLRQARSEARAMKTPLLRTLKQTPDVKALFIWSRRHPQRLLDFWSSEDIIQQLKQVDLSKNLSLFDLVELSRRVNQCLDQGQPIQLGIPPSHLSDMAERKRKKADMSQAKRAPIVCGARVVIDVTQSPPTQQEPLEHETETSSVTGLPRRDPVLSGTIESSLRDLQRAVLQPRSDVPPTDEPSPPTAKTVTRLSGMAKRKPMATGKSQSLRPLGSPSVQTDQQAKTFQRLQTVLVSNTQTPNSIKGSQQGYSATNELSIVPTQRWNSKRKATMDDNRSARRQKLSHDLSQAEVKDIGFFRIPLLVDAETLDVASATEDVPEDLRHYCSGYSLWNSSPVSTIPSSIPEADRYGFATDPLAEEFLETYGPERYCGLLSESEELKFTGELRPQDKEYVALPPERDADALNERLNRAIVPNMHPIPPLLRKFGEHVDEAVDAESLTTLARCVRFAKSHAQRKVQWRLHPAHITEILGRTNLYCLEVLRCRNELVVDDLLPSQDDYNNFMAIRLAHLLYSRKDLTPYVASDIPQLVARLDGDEKLFKDVWDNAYASRFAEFGRNALDYDILYQFNDVPPHARSQ